MKKKQKENLAEVFETTTDILPYLPELLTDLWDLGSSIDIIVDIFRELNLSAEKTKVLDLGCGKGAVSITLAERFGFQVHGIDLMESFIGDAKRIAKEKNVSHLCQFESADMHDKIPKLKNYDAVIFASIGGLLGDFNKCVGKLRKTVKSGGYILIDDGFLTKDEKMNREGYGHYASHEKTIRQLTAHGDKLVEEKIVPSNYIQEINKRYLKFIKKRVNKISERQPELADSLEKYINRQKEESNILENDVTGAVWLIQKK